MREYVGKHQKATTDPFSIPTLKQPTRGFGLDSSGASSQAVPLVQRLNKPVMHDISRMSLRPQTKLTVNAEGDVFEKEADKVASDVMRTLNQPVSKQSVQREELPEEEKLQMKSLADSITPLVQRRVAPSRASDMSEIETSINNAGSGQPLPSGVLKKLEPAFNADLSGLQTYTDSNSHQLNKQLGSQAFTTGKNKIFYGEGKSPENLELTAHEVTHTFQQGGAVQRKSLPDQEE